MNPRVFREYDIRGVADRDLDDAFVGDLGLALGSELVRGGARRIAVGRDCRLHSPRLHRALVDGLTATGLDVIDIGVVATPLLYFAVFHLDTDGGVQITGSHNPPQDNGFKILRGKSTLHGTEIQALRRRVETRDFMRAERPGTVTEQSIYPAYQAFALSRLALGPRRFKVVVDAGNGTGGVPAVPLLTAMGFPVTSLFCEMDGRFPNHHPDPTLPENVADLQAAVAREGAEVGIAFDGDADRIGVVDSRGRIIWGDQLMILLARAILQEQPGATFVSEVKCSKALYDEIAKAGGNAIMWRVGHSLIKEKMKETGALLAGEMSGHIFFAHRYLGYDDAVYTAARLLELLSRSDKTLAEHVDTLPVLHNTPEIRREVPDDKKFEIVRRAVVYFRGLPGVDVIDVDGGRVRWPDAWALVRASNTQASLVLRFEAESAERLAEVRAQVEAALAQIEAAVAPREVEFCYDLSSPYSYLAATQLAGLAARTGATVRWRPFVLGAVFKAADNLGTRQSGPRMKWVLGDVHAWAKRYGAPLRWPSRFPMNSIKALRLCVQAGRTGDDAQARLAQALFHAYFAEDQDLADDAALLRVLRAVGYDEAGAAAMLAGCDDPGVKDELRRNTDDALRRGAFGAPTFFVGEDLFFGNDRLSFVEDALTHR